MEAKEGTPKFPGFPFEPYSIQIDFMNSLYESLNQGGVSMLESPTGTGKTMSVICSALQWVLDRRLQQDEAACGEDRGNGGDGGVGSDDEPDWMRDFVIDKEEKKKEEKCGSVWGKPHSKKKSKEIPKDFRVMGVGEEKGRESLQKKIDAVEIGDKEFLLEEYESEDEKGLGSVVSKRKAVKTSFSSSSEDESGEEEEEEEKKLKVYFCSRTHSQLSQFIKELRRTVFANEMNVVSLGSRKNLCINEEVVALGNSTRINERCLELQKKKKNEATKVKNLKVGAGVCRTKASSGCPMLRKHRVQQEFRNEVSQQGPLDIEDLANLGRTMGACPYYGSRSLVQGADLVVLPYQSLLSKSSRETLGLNLKSNIIIIDEAHNLADSLINMYDSKITSSQLETVHRHVERYFERFRNLLGPANRRYIQTLMVLMRAFLRALLDDKDGNLKDSCRDTAQASEESGACDFTMAINDFLFELNIDNINLVKLLKYIKESNIMHKVNGYGEKVATLAKIPAIHIIGEQAEEGSCISAFQALADILLSLTNNDGDGRIIISRSRSTSFKKQGGYIKYVMLSGEKIFSEIVDEAHAVVLVGGTLQPIEETRERLFPWLPPNQLHFFSCGHIVPPDSIMPIAVTRGPTGRSFDFSFSSRSSPDMMRELGLLLCNLVTVVHEGIVVFFPSFDYENRVYEHWKSSGILERIIKRKCVFREPRNNMDVESVLKEYKDTIDTISVMNSEVNQASHNGAILLAVVGAKLSEGINLSDGMGRCIVMVGLPYPSPSDIELLERIKHIEGFRNLKLPENPSVSSSYDLYSGDVQGGFDILRSCSHRGKEYYENLCMKAVNQSIGRAIRHINDYAAILLVDTRYASDSSKRSFSHPVTKLPQWIKDRFVSSTINYGEVHRLLHQFFKLKKTCCH
ncbi:ATP-dependent DNA helicase DDX11 isoform X1 [Glycine soja]|uniref:ATP-dependent DNA helicase DDX11 n=2 Tax=Glycine soja TaxID=3848 RepID=A0A445JQD5_GLYSO|nr:ATP-dependent DNA helicase DDX11 isoform X1 [Glycine soja]RZC00678.1 ATP-dependent DNA helicase DDX11 [Glycine soja]